MRKIRIVELHRSMGAHSAWPWAKRSEVFLKRRGIVRSGRKLSVLLAAVVVICIMAQPSVAAPYYGWMSEYAGTSANTVSLWNFHESGIFDKWSDKWSPNQGPTHTGVDYDWDARIILASSDATFAAGGKWGWGLHNVGGSDGNDNAYAYHGEDIFPTGDDPSLSVETWVKFDILSQTTQYLLDKQYSQNGGYQMYVTRDSAWMTDTQYRLYFRVGDGTSQLVVHYYMDWATDQWYHVAGTWDAANDTLKLYIDGEEVGSAESTGSSIQDSTGTLRFAQRLGAAYYTLDGTLDGVRVSDVAYEYAVPEPATIGLLLIGLPFALRRRRR